MSDRNKIEKALNLLDELIGLAEIKDEKHKAESLSKGKSDQAVGESYDCFHLKLLRDILREN